MVAYRAQVVLKTDDAIVANYSTNSWCLEGPNLPTFTDVTAAIKGFYDDLVGYFPSPMAQSGHEIKYYDLLQAPPNYPIETATFNLSGNPTQTPFPSEVSVCLSFQGERISGLPQARRRGRLYIGPLGTNASGTDGRPSATFIGVLVDAAEAFGAALAAITEDWSWAVWSLRSTASVDVADGWVDNAWDTQRRRGIEPTSKSTFVI